MSKPLPRLMSPAACLALLPYESYVNLRQHIENLFQHFKNLAVQLFAHECLFLPRLSCGDDLLARLRQFRASQGSVGETLVNDALERNHESLGIVHHAVVESERLLVQIAE